MPSSRTSTKAGISAALTWIFPSVAIALLSVTGFLTEAVLLAKATDSVYLTGGPTPFFAILFLFWFWLTLGWFVWGVSRIYRPNPRGRHRLGILGIKGAVAICVAIAILVYVTSWGLFLQSGRFANFEAAKFLFANSVNLWHYLVEAEPINLIWFALCGALALGGVPLLLGWLGRSCGTAQDGATGGRHYHFVWRLATISMLLVGFLVTRDLSMQRKAMRLDALKCGLNPAVALVASGFESLLLEPVEACLNESDLHPIRGAVWAGAGEAGGDHPSIIIVAIESLRHDVVQLEHQGREVMPNLNALAADGLHLTRSYAQSTHSDYADVCIVSSLYPLRTRSHHYYRKGDPWPKTLIYDLLKQAGYATAIISSQNEAWGGMDQFLESPNLDLFYDPQHSSAPTLVSERDPGFAHEIRTGGLVAGKFPDGHTTDVAIDWIRRQVEGGRPFFLSMNFQGSHFPYLLPPSCPRPFQPCHLDADVHFLSYPREKTFQVRNAYYNAIHECDQQLGRLVEVLRELGHLDNTILVVLGENGEAFHEGGLVGHAREPIEPMLRVATIVHAPGRVAPAVEDYPVEHVDLAPTLLALAGLPSHPNFQGINVLAPTRPRLEERVLFFHVLSPLARADAVLLAGRWKLVQNHNNDNESLFDLEADPDETTNLVANHPAMAAQLRKLLTTWRKRQLAYYHYPMYYQSYFPPPQPRIDPLASIARGETSTGSIQAAAHVAWQELGVTWKKEDNDDSITSTTRHAARIPD